MHHFKKALLAGAIVVSAASAQAGGHTKCGIESGRVNILGNEFPAIQTVVAGAAACENVTVESNLTKEHRDLQVPALRDL
ncbi:MAG: hypothetical protein AAFO68_11005, partial [Pseudomonadota bacterium]